MKPVQPTPSATGRQRWQRLFLPALAVLALSGLMLRLLVCAQLGDYDPAVAPAAATDMATYRQTAMDILAGNWPAHFYYQPFYYAVFLPLVFLVCGKSVWGVMFVQALVGAATVWLAGLVAARLFGRAAGLLAAGLLAVSRLHIFYTPFMLLEVLQGFWLLLLTWLVLEAWHRRSPGRWLATGLVLGLAVLTRGNALLLLPGMLVLLAWRERRNPRRAAVLAAAILALTYLPQLPFALRNWRHHGRWTGPSSAQDAVLALGNNPEAPPGGLDYPRSYHEWMRQAQLPGSGRQPVSRQMLAWLHREPLALPELKLRTFLLFWDAREIPNNVSLPHAAIHSALLRTPLLPGFMVIGSLGVAGLLLALRRCRRSPGLGFSVFMLLAYALATTLFYMLARFRLPAVPLFCVFGGHGLTQIAALLGAASRTRMPRRRAYAILGATGGAALLVGLGFPVYSQLVEPLALRLARPRGVLLETPERSFAFDYGPLLAGGWGAVPLPPTGLRVERRFLLPKGIASLPDAVLRLAIHAPDGPAACAATVLMNGQSLGRGEVAADDPAKGVLWAEIPLGELRPTDNAVALEIILRPTSGRPALWIDFARDYGRSRIPMPGAPAGRWLPAEAVMELSWARAPARPQP